MGEPFNPKEVFLKALDLHEDERGAYLTGACPDDAAKSRIEALLRHHHQADPSFLLDPSKPAAFSSATPVMLGEFRILRLLGEGGMGSVYLAEDTVLGRQVALKILARHLAGSELGLARFRDEARNAAALQHPGIVPVFRFDCDNDTHYIVSEYVPGPTLGTLIAQRKGMEPTPTHAQREWYGRAAEIVAGLADALECAHLANIVHRDVKPSNVLMDPRLGPRLTDFGIAKHLTDEQRTITKELVGSCHYMSPEQALVESDKIDQRSDVFSLGVVLYELLSLQKPFDGANTHQVLRAVMECHPRRLRSIVRQIPKDLETICQKCMEKALADRYQSAAHVAADLRCFLADRPILASPPSLPRRIRHWTLCHRRLTLTAAFLALASTSVGALSVAMWRESHQWRARRCAVYLERIGDGVRVYSRDIHPDTFEVGTRTALSEPGQRAVWVLPGQYRFEFVARDDRFAEVDVFLELPGQETTITPVFVDEVNLESSMVRVPAGSFRFGGERSYGTERSVSLEAFWIDRYEVSNRQYLDYLAKTGRPRPTPWGDDWPPPEFDDRPVVGVTWDEMQAFARWAGKRLPTVLEWEYAARFPDGRRYPGGDAPPSELPVLEERHRLRSATGLLDDAKANYAELSRPVSADAEPGVLGLHFTFGNAAEMTNTVTVAARTRVVVLRGGSWMDSPESWDLRRGAAFPLTVSGMYVGFRCARSAAPGHRND